MTIIDQQSNYDPLFHQALTSSNLVSDPIFELTSATARVQKTKSRVLETTTISLQATTAFEVLLRKIWAFITRRTFEKTSFESGPVAKHIHTYVVLNGDKFTEDEKAQVIKNLTSMVDRLRAKNEKLCDTKDHNPEILGKTIARLNSAIDFLK